MNISRRDFVKGSLFTAGSIAAGLAPSIADAASEIPRVYFTKDLSAAGMLRLYAMVNHNITGKIAVKLHTGEPDGPNILPREWIKVFLAQMPHAHIVECNVLYPSPRRTTEGHRKTLEQNGWTSFTTVDIMDEDGDAPLMEDGGHFIPGPDHVPAAVGGAAVPGPDNGSPRDGGIGFAAVGMQDQNLRFLGA